MAKKSLTLLLVLVLIAPAIGFACDCCSHREAAASQAAYAPPHRDCCPTIDAGQTGCRIERQHGLFPNSSQIQISKIATDAKHSSTSNLLGLHSNFDRFGPPQFASEIPLYLAHRTLRL